MSQCLPLFLTRAAAIMVAGMLLFAVFSHAHAEKAASLLNAPIALR